MTPLAVKITVDSAAERNRVLIDMLGVSPDELSCDLLYQLSGVLVDTHEAVYQKFLEVLQKETVELGKETKIPEDH